MYRTQLAQTAHEAILSYIRNEQEDTEVTVAINNLDKSSILELSINEDSFLIDVLHLPFAIENNQPAAKCKILLKLLFSKAIALGPDVLAFLLKQPNQAGFSA
jgi:hypothetical protein